MAQVPHADPGPICPLHKQDMSEVCHKCPWWCLVRGKHPQSEELIDDWKCAIALLPMLMVENSQQTRGVQAAMETFRNDVVASVSGAVAVAVDRVEERRQGRLIDARNDSRK